ncbi:MAG TPA: 30S ribosomal protein S20 [Fimbriimonas sp.]|nr:30S ribosomal protein S20 [Fimbriimonas sp.]
MANIKSSKKDLKRNAKNRARNVATKSALKTYVKKVRQATPETVGAALTTAIKQLDKAAQRGIIHKNQAARRKSRIAKAANAAAKA